MMGDDGKRYGVRQVKDGMKGREAKRKGEGK